MADNRRALITLVVLIAATSVRKGRPLWFYAKLGGLPVGAKNRKQALVLTVGLAVFGFALALPPLVKIIMSRLA